MRSRPHVREALSDSEFVAPRAASVGTRVFWICLAWMLGSTSGHAQVAADTDPAPDVRGPAAELRQSLDLPGLQIAVAVDGAIVAAESVGFADVERGIPLESTHLFRIGSVSKLLTATAAARLQQAGKLDLDAPIGRYLDGLPEDKAGITARQLGGHLAGLGHYGRNDYVNTTPYEDVAASLDRVLAEPLAAEPGGRYAYSSYGFNLLGAVLQRAAGKSFPDVVAEQVLRPLAMEHTLVERSGDPPAGRASLYSRDEDGGLATATAADLTDRWPSGGFLSTAEDLVRLGAGVLSLELLEAAGRQALFTSQRDAEGDETGVGIGWRISRDEQGRRFVHHGGDTVGGRAFILLYPDHGVCVALLTNLTFAPLGEEQALELAAPYLGSRVDGDRAGPTGGEPDESAR